MRSPTTGVSGDCKLVPKKPRSFQTGEFLSNLGQGETLSKYKNLEEIAVEETAKENIDL